LISVVLVVIDLLPKSANVRHRSPTWLLGWLPPEIIDLRRKPPQSDLCPCKLMLPVHTGGMTWGISGPHFLAAYAMLVAGALLISLLSRWWVGSHGDDREPNVLELAYLNDRAGLACQITMAGLRRAAAVHGADLSTLVANGPLPAGSSLLARALHGALRQPQTWSATLADPQVGAALRRLKRTLLRRGWLLSPAQQRRIKLGVAPLFAVAAAGLALLVASAMGAGSAGGPGSVVGLILACAATLLAGWYLWEVPEVGRVGRRLLRNARRTHAQLAPRRGLIWSHRSVQEMMIGMALFGPQPLLAVDPGFAHLVGVRRAARSPFPRHIIVSPSASAHSDYLTGGTHR
jgi:uncharacterized protein (TIGR04222 family)